jgi:hypothetical protein
MNKKFLFLSVFFLISFSAALKAQSSPVIYFCEKYDQDKGEINIGDRFHKGYLTVMVKSDAKLGLKDVHVQFDKWDPGDKSYKFYKKFNFTIKPDMKYVFFSKNDESDMSFDEPGFFRVYLLNDADEIVASSIIQIIE